MTGFGMDTGGEVVGVGGSSFRPAPPREVSFAPNVRSERSSRSEEPELISIPVTPQGSTPPLTPSQASPRIFSPGILTPTGNQTPRPSHTPSLSKGHSNGTTPQIGTPKTPHTPALRSPRFLGTPLATPVKKAFVNMKQYLEGIGHFTSLNPRDAWLPITESRNGNAWYSAFHNVNAGVGFQSLVLPVAFVTLGWTWGSIVMVLAFIWQMYTLRLLVLLHEAVPGVRYNRYLEIARDAFGKKPALCLVLPPIMQLSAGTCCSVIIIGATALQLFYSTVCTRCFTTDVLTVTEWYLVFTCLCFVVSMLPNLNSISYVSLVGAFFAVAYCFLVWSVSVAAGRPPNTSYKVHLPNGNVAATFTVLNAVGNIIFAFRGHNLVLEIQATMPSSLKHPAHVPMWRGAKIAWTVIAICYVPMAIAGYWAYGDQMLTGGILFTLYQYHIFDASKVLIGLTMLMVVLNCISTFQIYAMVQFDIIEGAMVAKINRPVPGYVRFLMRTGFVFFSFFTAVALPFLQSMTGFLGGTSVIPVTLCYPSFMWLIIMKPARGSFSWYLNWILGIFGAILTVTVSVAGMWSIIDTGLKLNFFKPGNNNGG